MSAFNTGFGVTATLVRGDEVVAKYFNVKPPTTAGKRSETRRLLKGSGTRDALADLIRYCDEGGWKIRCLSTPSTIIRDLQGGRIAVQDRAVGHVEIDLPEPTMLGARRDLLENLRPTLTAPSRDGGRRLRRTGARAS